MAEEDLSMVEEREELMVSPTGGNPFLRKAHFLKPISPFSKNVPPLKLPSCHYDQPMKKRPLKIEYRAWAHGVEDWKTWVDQMAYVHHSTWKKAGIYQAVISSTYQIRKRNSVLVYGLAEKWCCETNTFIFPWGEATITLEDVMVLGGFSVLGDSVLSPLLSRELKEMEAKLNRVRQVYCGDAIRSLKTNEWLHKFMSSGSEFEHEAFLAYWLSRYVFSGKSNVILKHSITIAIHLARGTKVSLAPAVLASIYRDLGLLKGILATSNNLKRGIIIIRSPFHLVQVWAWERFLELRPNPNAINSGAVRIARWDRVNGLKVENLKMVLHSAGENFLWRPYALDVIENWHSPKYYPQKEMSVLVGPDLDDELLSYVQCLRASELVGLDTIENYLPHRVAMQFGFDQDIPCSVTRPNQSDMAWEQYIMKLKNVNLYFPSRLFEADVSTNYLKWWKQAVPSVEDAFAASIPRRKRTKRTQGLKWLPLRDHHLSVPPGFPPKHERMEIEDHMDEDKLSVSKFLKYSKMHEHCGFRQGGNVEKLSGQVHNLASPVAEESSVNTIKSSREDILGLVGNESASSSPSFKKRLLELQARCKTLESMVGELKGHAFGN